MEVASPRPGNIELNEQTRSSGSRRIIRLLSVVTVLGVLIGVAGLLLPKVFSYENGDTAQERKQVVARATDFAVAYNTYDVADVADYQKRMKGLLSASYHREFVEVTNVFFKELKAKKQVSKGAKVLAVAVSSIDKDSAVALVAVDASLANTDLKADLARHYRWKVTFVKDKGEWNVDRFESVSTVQASAGEPAAGTPTTEPTEGSAGE